MSRGVYPVRRGAKDEAVDMLSGDGWILPRAVAEQLGLVPLVAVSPPEQAQAFGHRVVVDPPASGMASRWTCVDCFASVLQASSGNVYGPALEYDCTRKPL